MTVEDLENGDAAGHRSTAAETTPLENYYGNKHAITGRLVSIRGEMQVDRRPRTAVYLDYAATTPVDSQVITAMSQCLGIDGTFGNAASRSHYFGWEAEKVVEKARGQVADLINADPSEIVWTSGATESINLAIKGVARGCANRGKHLVTSSLEHKAVLDSCEQLAREGFEVTYVHPDRDGLISPENVKQTLRDDTILVSLMHVNNEVGTVTDINAIGKITSARGIVFHVDAVQSVARLPLDTRSIQADLISLSGHKMYGPKGVGALYVRRSPHVRIEPQMHGGAQEQGLRSGTLATHQLVGMGEAAHLVREYRDRDTKALAALDYRLLARLTTIECTVVNGNQARRVAGILNIGFACVESESLMLAIKDVAVSSGSACTSSQVAPSHVLLSLGLSEDLANCSIRFSLGRFTTEEQIDFTATRVCSTVNALRQLSPQWQTFRRSGHVSDPESHMQATIIK